MREKVRVLTNNLKMFKNYDGKDLDLINILRHTNDYI
jgi:hypothetical protein